MVHLCNASCFATLTDLKAFREAKGKGWNDKQAFAVGDNGIGCYGDNTAQLYAPMCAVPPEDMALEWGGQISAKHKQVRVTYKDKSVVCVVADVMPHKANIKNGCGIDLNPAAQVALGFAADAEILIPVSWQPVL